MATHRSWLLQTDPDLYDIDAVLAEGRCRVEWRIPSYADDVAAGDHVFIWRPGRAAGIIAAGHFTTDVRRTTVPSAEASHYRDRAAQIDAVTQEDDRAQVEIQAVSFLPAQQLAALENFGTHHLFRFAEGTVFTLAPAQAAELRALVDDDAPPMPHSGAHDAGERDGDAPGDDAGAPPALGAIAARARNRRDADDALGTQDTRAALVSPTLRLLGWDTEDMNVVRHNWRAHPRGPALDYALFLPGSDHPALVVVARALGAPVPRGDDLRDDVARARAAGARWVCLTDGDQWCVHHAPGGGHKGDGTLLATASVADDPDDAWGLLRALAREAAPFDVRAIQRQAARATDAVGALLREAMSGPAPWLTDAVHRQLDGRFSTAEIASALADLRIRITDAT